MISAIAIAQSGLQASQKRLSQSADNIANQQSAAQLVNGEVKRGAYQPQQVQQVALPGGGVQAYTRPQQPATKVSFQPDSPNADADGLVELPDVDTADEIVSQKMATYDFKANLKTVKAQDEMLRSVIDILA